MLTGKQTSELRANRNRRAQRRRKFSGDVLRITVDAKEVGEIRLNQGATIGIFHESIEATKELVQVWAEDGEGQLLLASCLLTPRNRQSSIQLSSGNLTFDVIYDGQYDLTVQYQLKQVRSLHELFEFLNQNRKPILTTITAAAIVLLIVVGFLAFWSNRRPGPKDERAVSSPSPNGLTPTPTSSNSVESLIALKDGETTLLVAKDGGVTGPSIEALPQKLREEVVASWKNESVRVPDLSDLEGAKIETMGDSQTDFRFQLIAPVRQAVRSQSPVFRWTELKGTQEYLVTISDADTYEVVVDNQSVKSPPWTFTGKLRRGHNYVWQVTAVIDGKKVTMPTIGQREAKFRILPSALEDELKQAERSSPRSSVALGILYARVGLLAESRRELQAFAAANPQSATAAKLLGFVNQRLRNN